MSVDDVKFLYGLSCFVMCSIIAFPTIVMVVSFPGGAQFSELWLLGPGHMAEYYPSEVTANVLYKVYVGVGNHMGGSVNYVVYAKFRNWTESLPDIANGKPSVLEPLYEYNMFLAENETWEDLLSFSFAEVSVSGNVCRVGKLRINDVVFDVDKTVVWSDEGEGFYFQLFFELWLYDVMLQQPQYHNRFVGLWLNMKLE